MDTKQKLKEKLKALMCSYIDMLDSIDEIDGEIGLDYSTTETIAGKSIYIRVDASIRDS